MSAADEAWEEWADDIPGDPEDYADVKGIWMAGYRRALEDAADATMECQCAEDCHVERQRFLSTQREWLTARAAAVAPRETKD